MKASNFARCPVLFLCIYLENILARLAVRVIHISQVLDSLCEFRMLSL